MTDWRRRLVDRGLAPATINLALAAATSLLDSRALAAPTVARVQVAAGDARALKPVQLRELEKAIDALASPRDRAILQVLLRTGLRIGEVAALDRGDVQITQRTGQLVVRHGKGDHYRVVPLSRSARQALNTWLVRRPEHRHATPDVATAGPLWLSRTGARLSVRALNAIVAWGARTRRASELVPSASRATTSASPRTRPPSTLRIRRAIDTTGTAATSPARAKGAP